MTIPFRLSGAGSIAFPPDKTGKPRRGCNRQLRARETNTARALEPGDRFVESPHRPIVEAHDDGRLLRVGETIDRGSQLTARILVSTQAPQGLDVGHAGRKSGRIAGDRPFQQRRGRGVLAIPEQRLAPFRQSAGVSS